MDACISTLYCDVKFLRKGKYCRRLSGKVIKGFVSK